MSRKSSKRVTFTPDATEKPTAVFLKQASLGSCRLVSVNRKRPFAVGIFSFRLRCRISRFSTTCRMLRRLGAKVARVLRFVSLRRKSRKSPPPPPSYLPRSRSLADAVDSQRIEAIEDCIEFLNSSSSCNSLSRSSSVSTRTESSRMVHL
ncbi:unnamed protein product [Linum tenue]|uniref:Josephin-like protein n=2 Tax=Linum tenue TaxID=586396 RepID=A0AAV0KTM6_9ROSI|nr:unnamed protein product [Linum tenue]